MASLYVYVIVEYTRPLQRKIKKVELLFVFFWGGGLKKNTRTDLEGLPIVGNWVLESTR